MNSAVKSFDFTDAFICQGKLLSEIDSQVEEHRDNHVLSLTIAYIYAALLDSDKKIEITKELKPILRNYFPVSRFIDIRDEDQDYDDEQPTIRVKAITVSSPRRRVGLLMLPMFVSSNSTAVYNIYLSDSDTEQCHIKYNTAQANFFHKVIRSKTASTVKVLWKDPICNDTKLRERSYDETFLLYLGDKYLTCVWEDYIKLSSNEERLAACMEFADRLKKDCTDIKVKTVRDAQELSDRIFPPANCIDIDLKPVRLDVDETKSNLFDIIYFLLLCGLKKDSQFSLVVTGYNSYSHLIDVVKHFPEARITIWDSKAPKSDSTNIIVKKSILTSEQLKNFMKSGENEHTYIVSGRPNNDALLSNANYIGRLMMPIGSTVLDPALNKTLQGLCFMSLFTSKEKPRGQIVVAGGLSSDLSEEVKALEKGSAITGQAAAMKRLRQTDVSNFSNWLANNYRDMNLWEYPSKNKKVSFDQALLDFAISQTKL